MGERPIEPADVRRTPRRDFVGRTAEIDAFGAAVDSLTTETPVPLLLVGGDAGIGKSSLIAEAAARHDTPLLVASCVRVGSSQIPFAPLLTLLRRLNRSQSNLLANAPLLARWIEPGSTVEVRNHDILDATVELAATAAGAEGRMILAFEDLHWADTATWDLFGHLARNLAGHPVLLVGTYRSVDVDADPGMRRRLAELSRLPGAQRLALTGWSTDEVAERIESLLGESPSPVLVAEIASRADGNPFFTEQLVAARRAGDQFPEVVADLIVADLDRLRERERSVVSSLAVLGRPADEDLVCAVAALDADRESALRGAVESGLVVINDDRYELRHALIGEVAYRELLPGERRQRHRLAAEQLQARSTDRSAADRVGELAVHLDRAGDVEAAFDALISAGDASEHIAPAAALEHLLRAIELWDDAHAVSRHADLAGRLWQAADLASATHGNERAVELAERALTVGPPSRGWAWGHERLGRYLWASGRVEGSVDQFARAHDLMEASDDARGLAAVLAGLGQAELMRGDYDAAEACARRALAALTDPDDDRLAWVMAQRVLGLVVSHRGAPDTGVEMCERAVARAPSAHIRNLATIYLGLAHLAAGNFEQAATVALNGVADAQSAGTSRSFGGYFDALAAEALVRLGRWVEAGRLIDRHTPGETLPIAETRLAVVAAKLAARTGDRDGARTQLSAAAERHVDDWHGAFVTAGAADVELVLGNWTAAAEMARRGLDTAPGALLLWKARFTGLLVQAEVEAALDAVASRQPIDVAAAISELEALLASVEEDLGRHDATQLREVQAYLAHASAAAGRLVGPDPDAWRAVAERWIALGDAWLTAVSQLHEAADAAATGQARRAEDALRAAYAIAERLSASPLLDQIDDVARRARLRVDAPEVVAVAGTTAARLGLTEREAEVLGQLAAGATNREIGERLYISEKTASVHVSNILRKLAVTSRVEAAAVAQRLGLD